MYYLEPCSSNAECNDLIRANLFRDPAGVLFRSIFEAHRALDDFCERNGFNLSDLNVGRVVPAEEQ